MKSIKDRVIDAIRSVFISESQHAIRIDAPAIFKQADGKWRWVMYSSNSYEDSDKEIISQKALQDDVTRADLTESYGNLDWWHIPQLKLGTCDFNAMHGRILIESGLFDNDKVGALLAKHAKELQGSITFRHPEDQPDDEGVFHAIKRESRAMLPLGKASNFLTAVPVITKETIMDEAKKKALLDKLDGNDELITSILNGATKIDKKADESTLRRKSKADKKSDKEYVEEEDEEEEVEEEDKADDNEPVTMGMLKEMLMAFHDQLLSELSGDGKEKSKAVDERNKSIDKRFDTIDTTLKDVSTSLAKLTGKQPKILKGRKASESDDTVVDDPKIENKDITNQPDPIGELFKALNMGQGK